ncbi:PotD/PotF family extracellular solute-binding protein [Dactylosporangium sucinum]|uniref:Spermidine/putrescine ABC transporter substrate-binding protein n=1 Tax=Dactylosporangium sucinum TaxID=1424081 RepID=A0A917TVR6_9ACTN|nr:extracellular solute-binding protein [Dactylosporangium sucinum]GGM40210.1 spermidine/putrescine ABC transporter substrate-binding protein [Dactylosporangium sucinum]
MGTTLSRRGLLSLGLGVGAGTLLAACGGGESPKAAGNTRIVARCWGGVWETALRKVSPGFTAATGVEVLNDPGSDTVPLLQQKPGQYDLAWLIGNEAARGLTSGVLEPIDTSRIEKWDSIVKRLTEGQTKDGKVSAVPISYTASGILYKTDKVPFKITSWKDLWRPELKGQVALQNAPSIGGLFLVFTGARLFGNGPTDYEAGWAALERLKDNVQFLFTTSTDGVNKLAAGSVAAVVTIADQGIPLKSRGVETVVPAEGSTWSVQNLTIPAASKNKDQAYDFINYMLKDETQVQWAREGKAAPGSTTVTLPADVAANLVETPQIAESLWPIDWYEFGDKITEWTTRWQRIFGK